MRAKFSSQPANEAGPSKNATNQGPGSSTQNFTKAEEGNSGPVIKGPNGVRWENLFQGKE